MFHVKHSPEALIRRYKEIVGKYRKTLDLMSDKGFDSIDAQIDDARAYAETIYSLKLTKKNVLDVGSGVGLPAIIIAILLPDFTVNLTELRQKRASFLNIAVSQMALKNVNVFQGDVKTIKLNLISVVTAQAVADFLSIYCLTNHTHTKEVYLMSRKSETWSSEVVKLTQVLETEAIEQSAIALRSRGTLATIKLAGGIPCQR